MLVTFETNLLFLLDRLSLVPTSDIRIISIIIILNINISFLCSSGNVRAKNVKKAIPKVLDLDLAKNTMTPLRHYVSHYVAMIFALPLQRKAT